MKKIRVFLASSIGELRMDRLAVSEAAQELNDELVDRGIRIQLFMCEHFDTAIAAGGKQNEYNDFIRQPCELFINLYYTKVGDYTVEEYNVALETNRQFGLPQMNVFVKQGDEPAQKALQAFREKALADGVIVKSYTTQEQIANLFRETVRSFLAKAF